MIIQNYNQALFDATDITSSIPITVVSYMYVGVVPYDELDESIEDE